MSLCFDAKSSFILQEKAPITHLTLIHSLRHYTARPYHYRDSRTSGPFSRYVIIIHAPSTTSLVLISCAIQVASLVAHQARLRLHCACTRPAFFTVLQAEYTVRGRWRGREAGAGEGDAELDGHIGGGT